MKTWIWTKLESWTVIVPFFFVNLRNNPICKMSTEFRKFFFIVDKRFATSSESWLAISMQMHIAVIAQSINSFFSFCPVINELDGCLHQGIIYLQKHVTYNSIRNGQFVVNTYLISSMYLQHRQCNAIIIRTLLRLFPVLLLGSSTNVSSMQESRKANKIQWWL